MVDDRPMTGRRVLLIIGACVLPFCAGCEDVDWNWDLTWWEKPKRVVRPIRPQPQADRTQTATSKPAGDDPASVAQRPVERSAPEPAAEEQPARAPSVPDTASDRAAPSPTASDAEARPPAARRTDLPFYQFYLASGASPRETQAGEHRLSLKNSDARACATLLEMLYVPMGRSGSADDCYLVYENLQEFEAAVALAPLLDMLPQSTPTPTVGVDAAYKTGIAQMLWIVAQGSVVEPKLVDDCERHLVEALQSPRLPPPDRWVAGIMAGRLASDFKYDYASARSYYNQAEQVSGDGSLERMTALWWVADSLAQEGKTADAREVYQTIIDRYGDRRHCQIVRRSEARLEEKRKR